MTFLNLKSRKKPISNGKKSLNSGFAAEHSACEHIEQAGLIIEHRNYRCHYGEIDIIALDGQILVFIEVRMRNRQEWGGGADTVNAAKQKKIIRSALHYLQKNRKHQERICRFDVISIRHDSQNSLQYHFNWIKNAFETG